MRVLLTTDTVGGVWTFTHELSTELLRLGHSVALLSFGRSPSGVQAAWCAQTGAAFGDCFCYQWSAAPLEWMAENERAYSDGLPALLALIDGFRPDLVHSSQFCFGDLPCAVPTVITAHSDVLSWADACRPQGLDPSSWLDQYRLLVQRGLTQAGAIAAPTQWMSDTLCRHFRIPSAPRTIPNGRSVVRGGESRKRLQAVSVGRVWDEAKNLVLLTDVQSAIPILVAGEHRFEAVEAPVDTRDLTLLGPLAEAELLDLFTQSSFYIAPSLYEPFGLAPLEAAQCGCALLLHDLPSFRETWGDAAVYFNDAASLSALLASFSPATLLEAQARSFEQARQLTGSRMAEQYEALYREVLCASPAHVEELATYGR